MWMMAIRSRSYGWYVVGLLACLNFLSYGSRNVVFPVYDDLRAGFGFTNTELGLLGSVFMLSHALATVPIGWIADRMDRRRVVAVGVLLWSAAGMASAAVDSVAGMLVSRALVGVGTAACVPVANALLCDIFPAREKARTVSVFNLGMFLGGAGGFALGAVFGYPLSFMVFALPGFALALVVATIDVPPHHTGNEAATSWAAFTRDAREILGLRTMRWLLLGAVFMAFAAGGFLAWFADFVAATKGMSIERATMVFGAIALTAGVAGVVTGGVVADRLDRRVAYGRMATISIGFAAAVPFGAVSIFVDSGALFGIATWLTLFFITWYHGPLAAVVDDLVAPERAATAQATFIFVMHLLGTASSSYVVGVLADHIGLRLALLAPLAAVLVASAAMAVGCRYVGADRARVIGEPG